MPTSIISASNTTDRSLPDIMATKASQYVPIGWRRWDCQLEEQDEKCLAFAEDTCHAVAQQEGFKAANILWEPHNWSGLPEDKIPHPWHITAEFETQAGFAKKAHIYTSDGKPEWCANRRSDGLIHVVFQDDLYAEKLERQLGKLGRFRSMPELQALRRAFELASPRRQTKPQSGSRSRAINGTSWRTQQSPQPQPEQAGQTKPRRHTWTFGDKPKKDFMALASWR